MTTFTARNGITIRVSDNDRTLEWTSKSERWYYVGETVSNGVAPGFTNDSQLAVALREFFQHERDEANGVWRSQIDRTWTAVHEAGYPTVQFRNDDGMREFSIYPDRSNLHAWSPDLQEIGHEYLDSHPGPQPWDDANPGEAWKLREANAYPGVAILTEDTGWLWATGRAVDLTRIVDGQRIWPEDAS